MKTFNKLLSQETSLKEFSLYLFVILTVITLLLTLTVSVVSVVSKSYFDYFYLSNTSENITVNYEPNPIEGVNYSITNPAEPALLTSEQLLVASVLLLEAGGEEEELAMAYVYKVIHERSLTNNMSKKEVVLKPYQFSCLNNISEKRALEIASEHPKWEQALTIVSFPELYLSKVKANFNHYHHKSIKPYWLTASTYSKRIGNHTFHIL